MTRNTLCLTNVPETTPTARSAREVRNMLRDIAFVLQMTQQLKAEILAERASTETTNECDEPLLALV